METLYHVLWELVHVFFEHRGLLAGRTAGTVHDAGASSFLYPFLAERETDLDAVIADVRASVLMKAEEIGDLRRQTLTDASAELPAAAATLRSAFADGGRLLALGNGGSATDAMDVVADFRTPPHGWAARPAIDLTEDPAILTAIANDIGVEAMFQRQVIAYGREGDALIALSTSGNSVNVIDALVEARRRGLHTIALVGYDGGRVAAEGIADHVIVTRSQHIPRIQEAQASAYHVLRELVESCSHERRACGEQPPAPRARRGGRCRAWAFARTCSGWPPSSGLHGFVLNDERGVLVEVEGDTSGTRPLHGSAAAEAPPLAAIEHVGVVTVPARNEAGFAIVSSERAGEPDALVSPDTATCDDCLAELFDPADRRFRYPFVNCTNCGPRFTIVRGVPYDRPLTTMAGFEMCPACRREYDDPRDRRFHAQPNACPACGPVARLVDRDGHRSRHRMRATTCRRRPHALRDGLIVAVKGIGGFHLACRADSERAVGDPARPQAPRGQALRADGPHARGRARAGGAGRGRASHCSPAACGRS